MNCKPTEAFNELEELESILPPPNSIFQTTERSILQEELADERMAGDCKVKTRRGLGDVMSVHEPLKYG